MKNQEIEDELAPLQKEKKPIKFNSCLSLDKYENIARYCVKWSKFLLKCCLRFKSTGYRSGFFWKSQDH